MISETEEVSLLLDEPNIPEFCKATLSLDAKVTGERQVLPKTSGITNACLKPTNTCTGNNDFSKIDELEVLHDTASKAECETRCQEITSESFDSMSHRYFSSRDTILQRAVYESKNTIVRQEHGTFLGSWLLTMVDHWDNEKERLLLLCSKAIFIVKYDFIAMTLNDFECIPTHKVVRLTVGNLEYPAHSFAPKIQSFAGRFSSILRGYCNQPRDTSNPTLTPIGNPVTVACDSTKDAGFLRTDRDGVRISWGSFTEPKFSQLWNPWSREIPWTIFLSHPLFSNGHDPKFDVNDFTANLHRVFPSDWSGTLEYKSIIMETYVGIPALIHNYSQFGYYRVRGKVSF